MKLTRKHELFLIDIGLRQVIDNLLSKPKKVKPAKKIGRKWTKAQRDKFTQSMKEKWNANLKK